MSFVVVNNDNGKTKGQDLADRTKFELWSVVQETKLGGKLGDSILW